MDFDEIVVKDSPGLCRCCLSEGCYKDLSTEYTWMGDREIYADMLLECFDISITQHTEGPNGSSRLICEVCITRLRDACNFKKQVFESEKKFVDMVGRGDFKPKAVIVLEATPLKTEFPDPMPGPSENECEIEYLEDDNDYTDDYRDDEPLQKLQAAGITVSSLSVKGKRGKKRSAETTKPVKAEKKKKSEAKSKSKASKDEIKLMETLWDSLAVKRRHNLQIIFNFTSIIPFKWAAKYMCFYCDKSFNEADRLALRKHTKYHGECFPDNYAIKQLVDSNKSVKVDVSQITCELCSTNFDRLDEILIHVNTTHDLEYVPNVNVNLEPYSLNNLKCLMCYKNNNSFSQLEVHIKQVHPIGYAICSTCGQRFNSQLNLDVHIDSYHSPGEFVCDMCPQTFSTNDGLDFHKELLHDSICEICLQPFPTVKLKQRHIHAKHVTKFKCFACSKTFETKGSLRQHTAKCFTLKGTDIRIKVLEGEQEDMTKDVVKTMRFNMFNVLNMCTIIPFKWFMNRFRCFYCQLDFNDSQELREHSITKHTSCDLKDLKKCKGEQGEVKVDTSSLICKECSAVFDSLDKCIEHLISNHKLDYDKSAGTSFQEFKLHPKEMLCPFCNEKFSFFGNILKHINEKHFEKNFVCTYCGLFFCKEVNLRGHINSQHNVGLQCTMCPVKLQNKSKLIIHMANNHGEKISKCTMCSESFTSPYVRAKHMVEKHNLEYKCKYCAKIYPKNSFLQKHIKTVHPDKIDDYSEPSTSSMLDVKDVKKEPKTEDDFDIDLMSVLDCVTEGQVIQPEEAPYVRKSNGEMSRRKRNLQLVLNMSTVLPFKWFLSSFRCFYCKRNFSDPELLKEHTLKTHFEYFELKKALKRYKGENVTVKVDVSSLSCRICSSHFDDINVLIDHLIMSHDADYDKTLTDCFMPFRLMEDNMICLVCGEKFTFFGHLLIHYNDQHLSKDHICSFCGLTFSKFVNLRAHISNRHSEDTHTCADCSSEFPSKSRLLTHMARNHGTKVSKCRHCDESFTTPYLRSKHMVEKHNLEHRCPHCHKVFPKNSTMKTHIRRVHLRERNVQCDVCSEKFFDNTLLRLHMVKHEGVRNFKCDYCGKTFLWMKNLRAHVKAHTKDLVAHNMSMAMCTKLYTDEDYAKKDEVIRKNLVKRRNVEYVLQYSNVTPFVWNQSRFKCFYCLEIIKTPQLLREHTIKVHQFANLELAVFDRMKTGRRDAAIKIDVTDITCNLCSTNLPNLEQLINHLIITHDAEYDTSVQNCLLPFKFNNDNMVCASCDQRFVSFEYLLRHANKFHLEHNYKCEICSQSFQGENHLQMHHRYYHKEGGYKCSICNITLSTLSRKTLHEKNVHLLNLSTCPHCPETFKSPYIKKQHMANVHSVEELKIKCPFCTKVYPQASIMSRHMRRVHLREKNVSCEICGDQFFGPYDLKNHMLRHNGEKRFICSICGKKFTKVSNLNAHINVHTGTKRYTCQLCMKSFSHQTNLKVHMKTRHTELEVPEDNDVSVDNIITMEYISQDLEDCAEIAI